MKKSQESTFISLKANEGKATELANFLVAGAAIVEQKEPDTLLWSALRLDEETFGVFDTYPHPEGRAAHFEGEVAAALNQNASELVKGGWENGVLQNVQNPKILAAKVAANLPEKIEKAMYIQFKAQEGKATE
ncbi:MAG: hypothetical protein GY810_28965, partial [Aureispira sp.]|nr:hypothetical protein [Aureispira sp.]